MHTLTRTTGSMLALAAAVALMPSNANAQDLDSYDQECTAHVSPAQVEAGSEAVRVSVTLSEGIGDVTDVEQENADGIRLASPMDIPRTEMAADESANAIEMGADETTWTLWLDTTEAEEGTHTVYFVAGQNRCEAELEVVVP